MKPEDKRTAAPIITPIGFTDEDLLIIQNGVVLELKRTAGAGQIAMLEHTLKLYRKLEFPVEAAIARLRKAEEPVTPPTGEPNSN